ncbi:GTP cyclohydrolase II-domain-containing protein [Apiospora kogelbergensis]|uniref:GTP cyclohydrolase II-domain-containing protein n=1 Tax=Apiospora kogelbergensis TaxID=1337665 RepID=UPI00313255BB
MDPGKDAGQAGQQQKEGQEQQHVLPVATPTEQLPSFYSPRTQPTVPDHEGDTKLRSDLLNISALAATANPHPAAPTSAPSTHATATGATTPSTEQPPPPSLLSPQFTPPSTPGFATPSSESERSQQLPRGVPVDTARDGASKKRPRLLETLPEVQCVVRARIPTVAGTEMFLHLYTNNVDSKEHLAIVFGPHIRSRSLDAPRDGETEMDRMVRGAYTGRLFPGRTQSGMMLSGGGRAAAGGGEEEEGENSASQQQQLQPPHAATAPLVRIHSECYTGETAWSARCDCGEQLDEAARLMSLPAQDLGSDTVEANLLLRHPADARSYGLATAMLRDLGQDHVRLLTNNPDKIRAVEGPNREVRVVERVAMVPLSWKGKKGEGFRSQEVEGYLRTKIEKMGHMLDMGGMPP